MGDRVLKAISSPLSGQDQLRFARAYRKHYPALVAFVRRRVDNDVDAADIAQEAYLRILRYRGQADEAALKSILFQIAINLLADRARQARQRRHADHVPIDEEFAVEADSPSLYRQVASRQDLDRLLASVEKLPKKCRDVFVLRRFEGLSHRQIAQMLGISTKAVERYVAIGAALCRQWLRWRESP